MTKKEKNELPHRQMRQHYSWQSPMQNRVQFIKLLSNDIRNSKTLAITLFIRSIKSQYRQSIFGYAWLVFPALINTALWITLNASGVIRIGETSGSYPVFVLVGSLIWMAFFESVKKPMEALKTNHALLTKVKFPYEAPIIAGILEILFNIAIRIVLLVPVVFIMQKTIPLSALWFIPSFLIVAFLGTTIGMLFMPIGLLYDDIQRGINLSGQFLMYATPVVYPRATQGVLKIVHDINPISYPLEMTREALISGHLVYFKESAIILIVSAFLFIFSWLIFRLSVNRIIERIGM